jgi:hypothetical protein
VPETAPKDEESGPAAGDGADLARFGAAATESRDAAKWLLAGFGAIAAVLVAGTQLSSIGSLDDPARILVAVLALAIGLTAVALAAAVTALLLLPGFTTLSDIATQEARGRRPWDIGYVGDVLDENPEIAEGYATQVSGENGLLRKYRTGLDKRAEAYREYLTAYASGDATRKAAKQRKFNEADAIAMELGRVAKTVTTVASYRRLNRNGRGWTAAVTVLALVTGIAVAAFAWAANPPKDDASDAAGGAKTLSMRGAVLTNLDLSGRDLSGVDFTGATFDGVNLRGAKLNADNLGSTTWKASTCPDGVATVGTESCVGHLIKE